MQGMTDNIKRKKNTGEPTNNGGEFGSKEYAESEAALVDEYRDVELLGAAVADSSFAGATFVSAGGREFRVSYNGGEDPLTINIVCGDEELNYYTDRTAAAEVIADAAHNAATIDAATAAGVFDHPGEDSSLEVSDIEVELSADGDDVLVTFGVNDLAEGYWMFLSYNATSGETSAIRDGNTIWWGPDDESGMEGRIWGDTGTTFKALAVATVEKLRDDADAQPAVLAALASRS